MASEILFERAADFGRLRAIKTAGTHGFLPQTMAHVYVKLRLQDQYENASSAEDAKKFLRSIARAAMAAHHVALRNEGLLLEVQGSMLHIGLPRGKTGTELDSANSFVADLHSVYRIVFSDAGSRVESWRMTVDAGKTLIVASRGVHGDDSWVSLGKSANRPAKYLYAQLELSEEERALKAFYVAVRQPLTGRWLNENLDRSKSLLKEARAIAEDARQADPKLDFFEMRTGPKLATARALPIDPAGTPMSPTADKPQIHFGWVLRTDLDGFTARVEECFDNDQKLQQLSTQFYCIMEAAAQFTARHKEQLAQLPWAGDNYTAAATFPTKDAYDAAAPKRLVDLSLDFEKAMAQAAIECGFGGWAHGVAGGDVHGNAGGNVYLAGVEVDGRRFLVGAGEGFGRSAKAFGEVNPKCNEIVLYEPDWARLDEGYKTVFRPATTVRKKQSTLYRVASLEKLLSVRAKTASSTIFTKIEFPNEQPRIIPSRPHYK